VRNLAPEIALVVLAASGAAGVGSAGELRGRLLLAEAPAAGVTVSAVPFEAPLDAARREARGLPAPQPIASTKTTQDGSFALAVPAEPGKERLLTVGVGGGGAAAAAFAGVWAATESADLGEHVLLAGSAVTGKVVDGAGKPVGGAEVTVLAPVDRSEAFELDAAARSVKTSADGTFRVDGAAAAGNVLTVDKAGFSPARVAGVKGAALAAPIGLAAGVPVRGAVLKSDGHSPAAGALVRLEGRVTTRWVETGSDGTFAIAAAPRGAFTVVADAGAAGYAEQSAVVLPLAEGKSLALALRPPSALSGRTLDAKTGRPVARVRVEVRTAGATRATRSGPDGSYAFTDLPPRSWAVRADELRYVPWTEARVAVRPGEPRKLDIPLVLGASISGRVTDEQGMPVGGAKGSLSELGPVNVQRVVRRLLAGQAPLFRTAADGTFKAARIAPGENRLLTVSHPEFERGTLGGLVLAPGVAKAGIAIVLKRGATVAGVVKGPDGQPVAGAAISLARPFTFGGGRPGRAGAMMAVAGSPVEPRGATTAGDGTFGIHGVVPGEYVLTAARAGYATERVDPVKVPENGSPAPIAVTLGPGATISGRVARKSGEGVEGFVVRAVLPGAQRFVAAVASGEPTGPDGLFSLDGLKPGTTYDLQALGPTGIGDAKRGVAAPASGLVLTADGPGSVSGKVLDAADGHPITDFQVWYEPDRGGFRAIARGAATMLAGGSGGAGQPVEVQGSDGTFTLEDVPAGTWSVVASAAGYQPGRTAGVEVTEGGSTDGVEVRVAKGSTVKGHVTDATTGAPVANASVSIAASGAGRGPMMSQAAASETTTDAAGQFELDGVATGKQPLHVTHPDYSDATQIVAVTDDGATADVHLTAGGVVAGTVVSESGQPVPNASVSLIQAGAGGFGFGGGAGAQTAVTDPSGQFRFDHLASGRYTAEASLGSHTSEPADVVVQAGQPPQAVTLQLQLGVTVNGTVSGLPPESIAGTTVAAAGSDSYFQSTRVGADGRFEFDNVPVGVVTLRGTATDPSGSSRSVTKQVTTTSDQPVTTADLVFDQGFTLSGRVTQSNQPVSGAVVFANLQGGGGRQASATTDDGGAYQLNGLQAGTYTVNAMSAQAGSSSRQTVDVSADQTLDISFPRAKIAGQVVDADGNMPLANATVTVRPQDGGAPGGPGQRPVTTDSTGQFSFTGLDEATYTLSTSKPDYQVDTRDAAAADPAGDAVVVALKRAAGIGIRVQDGITGVPLPSVMVRVLDGQGGAAFGPSTIALDSTGQGEIPSVAPGTYSIVAGASGYAPARLDGVAVPSGVVTISLTPGGTVLIQAGPKTLAAGTATGTVTTPGGQPALLSLFNLQGRIAISEPNVQLRNVPPGSYVVTLPVLSVLQSFTVGEGGVTQVPLP